MLRAPLVLLLAGVPLAILARSGSSSNFIVPNFPDLTVKVRTTMAGNHSITVASYFKGSRQRTEMRDSDAANIQGHAHILDCENGVQHSLDAKNKTYFSWPLDPLKWAKKAPRIPQPEMSGGEVTVTTDSVDTGERRQYGNFEARHVKTTITAEPGPDAVSKASKTEIDGWYLDIPGMGCRDTNSTRMGWSTAWSGRRDRVIFKQLGVTRRGLAIEETNVKSEAGHVFTNTTKLLEISEQPLDLSSFEVPQDYTPAHPDGTRRSESETSESAPE